MYLFKLKAYLSSIKGNYIPRYKAQPSPEWPLSVGRCGGSARVCGCQNNYGAVSVCVGSTQGGICCFYISIRAETVWAAGQHGVCTAVFLSVSCLPTADFLWCFSSGGFCTVHLKFTRSRKRQSYNFLLFVALSVEWTGPEGKRPVVSRIIPKSCCQHVREKNSEVVTIHQNLLRLQVRNKSTTKEQETMESKEQNHQSQDSRVINWSWRTERKQGLTHCAYFLNTLPVSVSLNNPRASFFSHQPWGNPFYLSQMEGQSL